MLQKALKALSVIIFLIGLFYLGTLVYNRFFRTETVIDKKIEKVSNEKKIIQSEIKLSYREIDSLKKITSNSEKELREKIKQYNAKKETLEKKLKEDEKNTNINNPDNDSIYRYLSRYKFTPF